MNRQTSGPPDKLHELLCEQRQLLTQYLLLTREQEKIVAGEEMEGLNKILKQRDQVLGQLAELLLEFYPLWQAHAASSAPQSDLTGLHEEISRILRQASEIDAKNQLILRRRMDLLREQLRLAGETRRGAETYIKGAELFSAGYVDERQ